MANRQSAHDIISGSGTTKYTGNSGNSNSGNGGSGRTSSAHDIISGTGTTSSANGNQYTAKYNALVNRYNLASNKAKAGVDYNEVADLYAGIQKDADSLLTQVGSSNKQLSDALKEISSGAYNAGRDAKFGRGINDSANNLNEAVNNIGTDNVTALIKSVQSQEQSQRAITQAIRDNGGKIEGIEDYIDMLSNIHDSAGSAEMYLDKTANGITAPSYIGTMKQDENGNMVRDRDAEYTWVNDLRDTGFDYQQALKDIQSNDPAVVRDALNRIQQGYADAYASGMAEQDALDKASYTWDGTTDENLARQIKLKKQLPYYQDQISEINNYSNYYNALAEDKYNGVNVRNENGEFTWSKYVGKNDVGRIAEDLNSDNSYTRTAALEEIRNSIDTSLEERLSYMESLLKNIVENPDSVSFADMTAWVQWVPESVDKSTAMQGLQSSNYDDRKTAYDTIVNALKQQALTDAAKYDQLIQDEENGRWEDKAAAFVNAGGDLTTNEIYNPIMTSYKDMDKRIIEDVGSEYFASDKQRNTYQYLIQNVSKETADAYLRGIKKDLNYQRYQVLAGVWEKEIENAPVRSAIAYGTGAIGKSAAGISDLARSFFNPGAVDEYDQLHDFTNQTNIAAQVVPETLNWTGDAKLFGQDLDSWIYGTVYSSLQSASNMLVANMAAPAYAAQAVSLLMGIETLSDTISEAKKQGYTDSQAAVIAIVRGSIEAATEKWSIERILNDVKLTNGLKGKALWAAIGNTLKNSAISEGSEEFASNVLNNVFDILINAPENKIAQMEQNISNGMPAWQAISTVVEDMVGEDISAVLAGAVSGVAMTGTSFATMGASKVNNAVDTLVNGKEVIGNAKANIDNLQAKLTAEAKELGADNRITRKAIEAENTGKALSDRQLYALQKSNVEQVSNRNVDTVKEAVKNRLEELGAKNAEEVADAIVMNDSEYLSEHNTASLATVLNEISANAEWYKTAQGSTSTVNFGERSNNREITEESNAAKAGRKYDTTLSVLESQVQKGSVSASEFVKTADGVNIADENRAVYSVKFDGDTITVKTTNAEGSEQTYNFDDIELSGNLTKLINGAKRFGAMSQSVYDAYVPGQNVDEYLASAKAITEMGGQLDNVTDSIAAYMSESRFGYGLNKAQVSTLLKAGMEEGVKSRPGTNAKAFTKGASTVTFAEGVEQKFNDRIAKLRTGNAVQRRAAAQMKASVDLIRELSRITGIDFEMVDNEVNKKYEGYNGKYIDGKIYIDINAGMNRYEDWVKSAVMTTVSHEVTHWIKDASPAAYADLMTFVIDKLASSGDVHSLDYIIARQLRIGTKASKGEYDFNFSDALEEVVSDGCQMMLKDSKVLRDFLLQNEESGMTFVDHVRKTLKTIRRAFAGNEAVSPEAKILMKYCADELQEKFDSTLLEAINSIPTTNILKDKTIKAAQDDSGESLFSYRTMKEDEDGYREDLKPLVEKGILTQSEVDSLFETIDYIMKEIESNPENARLFDTNLKGKGRRFTPFKSNADPHYGIALDFSTICRKRLLQQVIVDRLNDALNRNLSAEDQLVVNKRLRELQKEGRKIELACDLCYVEAARYNSPKWINEFINHKSDAMKDFYARKDGKWFKQTKIDIARDMGFPIELTKTGKEKLPTKKSMGALKDEFYQRTVEARKNHKLSEEQQKAIDVVDTLDNSYFTTADGLLELKEEYPEIYDCFAEYIRNHARGKAVETRTEYKRGDIASYVGAKGESKNFIQAQNESGTRMQSWSDFEMVHILDHIASVIELSTRKAKAHTYTKVPEMVLISGNTGIMFNLSMIPAGDTGYHTENGKIILDFDGVEGMPKNIADGLRNRFHATAGNIAIGCCDEQIIALMQSDAIDYIIPYHVSGMPAVLKAALGMKRWHDYTETQNGKGKQPSLHEWFDIEEATKAKDGYAYMEKAVDKYLQLCNELGSKPKFWQFLEQDANGNWQKKAGVSDKGYWKLLIDRKMVDQVTGEIIEQQAIKPVFNRGEIEFAMANEKASESRQHFKQTVEQVVTEAMNGKLNFSEDTRKNLSEFTKFDNDLWTSIAKYEEDTLFEQRTGISLRRLRGEKQSARDSEGNELSTQQHDYFKDSKVRDEDGNLRVVYHGSDADFTVFDRTKARTNMDIQGSFFSPWDIDAGGYGENVKAYYLNIKNPAPEGLAYKALNRFKGQNGAGIKAREYLESLGYDGVNNGDEEYIAFYPEQIKLVENKKPTSNEDIRYSSRMEDYENPAIYIQNSKIGNQAVNYTDDIFSGKKTIETRTNNLLSKFKGKEVAVIKNVKGKRMLVGYITLANEEPIHYETVKQFRDDEELHRVFEGDKYDIVNSKNGEKYGYKIESYRKIDPVELKSEEIASGNRTAKDIKVRYDMGSRDIERVYYERGSDEAMGALRNKLSELFGEGKYVSISGEEVEKATKIMASEEKIGAKFIKNIIKSVLKDVDVSFEINGNQISVYLTRENYGHISRFIDPTPENVAILKKFTELIGKSEYAYSQKNDGHSNTKRIDLWDTFVTAVKLAEKEYGVSFNLRKFDYELREQLYAMQIRNKGTAETALSIKNDLNIASYSGFWPLFDIDISQDGPKSQEQNSTRTEESDALSQELALTDTIDSLEANKNTGVGEIEKLERDFKAEQKLADKMYTGRKLAEERRKITTKYENKLAALSKKLDERIMADQMHEGAAIAKAVRENTEQYKRELQKQSDKSLADQMYLGRKLEEEKRILSDRYDRQIASLKVSKQNAIESIKEANAASWRKYREKKSATELRHKIIDLQKSFERRFKHPTAAVGGHIPAGLRTATMNVLNAVNMDRVEADARIAQLEIEMAKETAKENPDKAKLVELAKRVARIQEQGNNLHAALSELHSQYEAIAKQENSKGIYNSQVSELIQNLAESFSSWQNMIEDAADGTAIRSMTVQQLSDVYDVLKALDTTIKNVNKLIDSVVKKDRFEVYQNLIRETKRTAKQSNNIAARFFNKMVLTQLRPETAFKSFGGFTKGSYWSKMAEDLNRGQLKMTRLQSEWSKLFFDLLNDRKNLKSMQELVDIGLKDADGETVMVSRGMMLSLYMHLMNDQNRKHIEVGGMNIPESAAYYKGDKVVAYKKSGIQVFGIAKDLAEANHEISKLKEELQTIAEDDVVNYQRINDEIGEIKERIQDLRDNQLAHYNEVFTAIQKQLTDYERRWIEQARYFEDSASPEALNEVTEKLYGFSKARVQNYWQIVTDPDFLHGDFASIVRDASIENVGFMKERIEGTNPIILEDMADVIARQIRSNSQYAGMLIPITNFNKIYNGSSEGNTVSLKKVLGQHFGDNASTYIEKLMGDLQGAGNANPTVMNFDSILSRARSGMAGSALTLSLSTAMAQTASYPTAAAEIGWKPLMKALAVVEKTDGSKRFVIARAEQDMIRKYSPLLWYRLQGYSTTEIGDMQSSRDIAAQINQKARWLTGWIQAMDGMTVGRLWYASQYYVDDLMKKGTVEVDGVVAEKGNDAYYKKVAEVFNNVIERTQPNYTAMQRPDILRSKSGVTKMLTMFMTQRLQNFNIVYDAAGSVARAEHDLRVLEKNGASDADLKVYRNELRANRLVLGRAVASQLAAAFAITIMKTAAKFLLHNVNSYRDDEGELDESWKEMVNMFLGSIAGNIMFGDAIYNVISSMVTGKKLYDQFNAAGIDELNSIISDFANLVDSDAWKNKDFKSIGKKCNAFAVSLATILGIPLNNAEKIAQGIYNHIVDLKNGELGSFEAGYERSNKQNVTRLYEAFASGDTEKVARVTKEFAGDDGTVDLKSVDSKIKSRIREEYEAGNISQETATKYLKTMMQSADSILSDDDIFWLFDKWNAEIAHEDEDDWTYGKYNELRESVTSGSNLNTVIKKYTSHGVDANTLREEVGKLKEDYTKLAGTARTAMRSKIASAYAALGMKEDDIESKLLTWDMKSDTGYDYSNIREDYVEKQAYDHDTLVEYYVKYGGKSEEAAEKQATRLDAAIATGIYTEDLKESFVDKEVSEEDTIDYLVTYQAYEEPDARKKVKTWTMERDTGYDYDDIAKLIKSGTITTGTAKQYYMTYGGYNDSDAQSKVNTISYGIETGYDGASATEANAYYTHLKSNSISASVWHTAYATFNTTKPDYKENGKAVTNSKMKKFFAYVNTLNLSKEQKKAVALAVGYSESKVRRYAWT